MENESIVPGLPENLRPNFWKGILHDIIQFTPEFDKDYGYRWIPVTYIGAFAKDLPKYLDYEQITDGLEREINRYLDSLISVESKEQYLERIERPDGFDSDIHVTRNKFEEELEEMMIVDSDRNGLICHIRLLKKVEQIIEEAYISILPGNSSKPVGSPVKELIESDDYSAVPNHLGEIEKPSEDNSGLSSSELAFLAYYNLGKTACIESTIVEFVKPYGKKPRGVYQDASKLKIDINRQGEESSELKTLNKLNRIKKILPLIDREKGREEAKNDIDMLERIIH